MNRGHAEVASLLMLCMLSLLSACGSRQAVPSPARVDETFERTRRAASAAFAQGAYAQAADLYRQALEHAYRRDDVTAIVDMQYNLAVVLLRTESLTEARQVVDDAHAELARANRDISVSLMLLDATLLYRSGQTSAAWRLSDKILTRVPADATVNARTQFLRGLIAAQRGDTVHLREAVTALAAIDNAASLDLQADRDELRGDLALAERRWATAMQAFDRAAAHRRATLDYAGMVRALAKAGDAASHNGQQQAAGVYYLRAGRSAALQGQKQAALNWLKRAQLLTRQSGDTRTLQDVKVILNQLREP